MVASRSAGYPAFLVIGLPATDGSGCGLSVLVLWKCAASPTALLAYVLRRRGDSQLMTEEEQMDALGPVVNEALQKLLPQGMKCVVVLYNGEHRLTTLGNVHPRDARTLLKSALSIVETQLAVEQGNPANDDGVFEPHRCRYCRRPVKAEHDMCESCYKLSSPQQQEKKP